MLLILAFKMLKMQEDVCEGRGLTFVLLCFHRAIGL